MIKKIIKLFLIVTWMGIIFSFSQDNGNDSEKKSDSIILTIYKIFDKRPLTEDKKRILIDRFVYPVRKLAHFSEYLILGILVISFISEFKQIELKYIIISILVCCLYAVSDEIHQLFVANRSGKITDVIIDTFGSSTGILIYDMIKKIRRRKNNE